MDKEIFIYLYTLAYVKKIPGKARYFLIQNLVNNSMSKNFISSPKDILAYIFRTFSIFIMEDQVLPLLQILYIQIYSFAIF